MWAQITESGGAVASISQANGDYLLDTTPAMLHRNRTGGQMDRQNRQVDAPGSHLQVGTRADPEHRLNPCGKSPIDPHKECALMQEKCL